MRLVSMLLTLYLFGCESRAVKFIEPPSALADLAPLSGLAFSKVFLEDSPGCQDTILLIGAVQTELINLGARHEESGPEVWAQAFCEYDREGGSPSRIYLTLETTEPTISVQGTGIRYLWVTAADDAAAQAVKLLGDRYRALTAARFKLN